MRVTRFCLAGLSFRGEEVLVGSLKFCYGIDRQRSFAAVVEIDDVPSGQRQCCSSSPRNNLARLLHESNEQLEWAVLEPDADAVPAQFAGAYIHAEPAELESRN
jgi:hypothetical protein